MAASVKLKEIFPLAEDDSTMTTNSLPTSSRSAHSWRTAAATVKSSASISGDKEERKMSTLRLTACSMGRTPSERVADAVGEKDAVGDDERETVDEGVLVDVTEGGGAFRRAAVVVDLDVSDPVAVDDDVLVAERLTVVDGAADADEGCDGAAVVVAIAVAAAL